jgi:hypothetical protein
MAVAWLLAAVFMLRTGHLPDYLGLSVGGSVGSVLIVAIGLIVSVPIVADDFAVSRLQLAALLPMPRSTYFICELIGRVVFVAAAWAIGAGGVVLLVRLVGVSTAPGEMAFLFVLGMPVVSVLVSVTVVSRVIRHRVLWCVCWVALFVLIGQARDLSSTGGDRAVRIMMSPITEVIGPMLVGPTPEFQWEATLGPWYAARAVSQWAFGILVATFVGAWCHARMELGSSA